MWTTIVQHAQENAGKMVFGTLAAIFLAIAGVGSAVYQANVNRIAELRLAEVKEISTEKLKFNELLQSFTGEVAIENKVDSGKKTEMAASLTRLYGRYGSFKGTLPTEDAEKIETLMSAINEFKKSVQLTKEKSDLDRLSISAVYYFRHTKIVDSIIGTSIGVMQERQEGNS